MWFQARQEEKKLRNIMIDHKKRVDRRKMFYERIKKDPVEFMQLHGRRYKIHIDAAIASAADNPSTMRPWQGDSSVSIDRFDVRAHLDYIPETKSSADELGTPSSQRNLSFERYRILIFNEFEKVPEDKFLKQIFMEENCMTSNVGLTSLIKAEEQKKRKSASQRAAINFNYDDPDATSSDTSVFPVRKDAEFAEESSDSEYEPDFDKRLDVSELTTEQCKLLNSMAVKYGMRAGDFSKCMWEDYEEQARIQNLKEIEDERVALAGKQSRRERKLLKEIRIRDRGCVARPLDVLRIDNADNEKTNNRSYSTDSSSSSSESSSDEEIRKTSNKKDEIQFITTFGDPEESDTDEKLNSSSAVKHSDQSDGKNGNSFHSKIDKRLQLSRPSSKRSSPSRSPARRRTPTSYRQTRKSRSPSPLARYYRRSSSRSRRYSRSPRLSDSRRYNRRSRPRSKNSRSRSRSRKYLLSSKDNRSPSRSTVRSKRVSTRTKENKPCSSKSNRDSLLFEPTKIVNDCNGRKVSIDPTIRDSYTPTVPHAQDNVESDTDASLPLLSIHSEMSDSEQERRQVENTKRRLRKMRRALKSESKSTTQNYENRIISSNDRDEKSKPYSALDKLKLQTQKALRKNLAKDKEEERQKQEELKREQEQREDEIREISLIMRKRDKEKEKSDKSPVRPRKRSSSSSCRYLHKLSSKCDFESESTECCERRIRLQKNGRRYSDILYFVGKFLDVRHKN